MEDGDGEDGGAGSALAEKASRWKKGSEDEKDLRPSVKHALGLI